METDKKGDDGGIRRICAGIGADGTALCGENVNAMCKQNRFFPYL
jgi:hypothetical protein